MWRPCGGNRVRSCKQSAACYVPWHRHGRQDNIRGLYGVLQDIRHVHRQIDHGVATRWTAQPRWNHKMAGPYHVVERQCIAHDVQDCLTTHRNNRDPSHLFPTTSHHGDHARIRYTSCKARGHAPKAQSTSCGMDEGWHIQGTLPSSKGLAYQHR
jgi:hypothetical protein